MTETTNYQFEAFAKIPRLNRGCVISEKIDGTNAQVFISEDGDVLAGSRTRWLTPEQDNFGFARWVEDNRVELLKLGPGRHFGEWWGLGIQRNYGLREKRFSLFNTGRWSGEEKPECCSLVPVLYEGNFSTGAIETAIEGLLSGGSYAAPGFMKPEGIVVYHAAAHSLFKVLCENDDTAKGEMAA